MLVSIDTCLPQGVKLSRLYKRGDLSTAIMYAEDKVEGLHLKNSKPNREQFFYVVLGKVYYDIGDYSKSEFYYKKAITMVDKKILTGKKLSLRDYNAIDELALFYINTGNMSKGKSLAEKSLAKRLTKWNKGNTLNYRPYLALGKYHLHFNQKDSARFYLKNYQRNIRNSNYTGFLDINRYADTYQLLTELAIKDHEWKKARVLGRKTKRLQKHAWTKKESGKNYFDRITAANTLSMAYRRSGKLHKAQKLNDYALRLFERHFQEDHAILIPIYVNRSWLDWQRGDIPSVRLSMKRAIDLQMQYVEHNFTLLSEYEKENVYKRMKESFNALNALIYELNASGSIDSEDEIWTYFFDYILTTKGLILSKTNVILKEALKVDSTRKMLENRKKLKNLWALTASSSKKKNRLNNVEVLNAITDLEKKIASTLSIHLKDSDANIGWKSIQSQLNDDEVAIDLLRIDLDFLHHKSKSVYLAFAFNTHSQQPKVIAYENGIALENKIKNNYFNAINYNVRDNVSYNAFWQPIEEVAANAKTIFVAADGIFHLINLDVLANESNALIETKKIVNLTSLKKIIGGKDSKDAFSSICLLGAPNYSAIPPEQLRDIGFDGKVPFLKGSEEEVLKISTFFEQKIKKTERFLYREASERQLKSLPSFDILHLSTHGFFIKSDHIDPMFGSGLLFSKEDSSDMEDGILTAYEAATLNLENTNLVVLSACKTGQGEVEEGEGVYGLQRAFEIAGVNNIIMSLWNVDDQLTKEFMIEFYKQLMLLGRCEAALRYVQLKFKEKYKSPFYWGGFKLIKSY